MSSIDPQPQVTLDSAQIDLQGYVTAAGRINLPSPLLGLRVLVDGQDLGSASWTAVVASAREPRLYRFTFEGFTSAGRPGLSQTLCLEVSLPEGHFRIPFEIKAARFAAARSNVLLAAENILIGVDRPEICEGGAAAPLAGGVSIEGWALGLHPIERVVITIDGLEVGTVHHGIRRWDVQAAFPTREGALMCGFALCLPRKAVAPGRHSALVTAWDAARFHQTLGFGFDVEKELDDSAWRRSCNATKAPVRSASRQALGGRDFLVCIVLDLREGDVGRALTDTLASLARQTETRWRLVCDVPPDRLRHLNASRPGKLPALLEQALAAPTLEELAEHARGEPSREVWMWPIRPGDVLAADAVANICAAATEAYDAEIIYGDERCHNIAADRIEPFQKPGWSPELLLATNYFGRAFCVRLDLVRRCGVGQSELHDTYNFALRCTEKARAIAHVDAVLSERGPDPADTAEGEAAALSRAMTRRCLPYEVIPGLLPRTYGLRSTAVRDALVSIIIPTCAAGGLVKRCLDSLKRLTAYRRVEIIVVDNILDEASSWKPWLRAQADVVVEVPEPFNWSRFNNLAAREARGDYLLFLNDDTEIIQPDWLDAMLDVADLPGVGVVGPRLLFPDGTVQHAGMDLTPEGPRHIYLYAQGDDPCDFGLALTQRNVDCVTGACMLMRRPVFDRIGDFDERFDLIGNDVNFCLRTQAGGFGIVFVPHVALIHEELSSRKTIDDRLF